VVEVDVVCADPEEVECGGDGGEVAGRGVVGDLSEGVGRVCGALGVSVVDGCAEETAAVCVAEGVVSC